MLSASPFYISIGSDHGGYPLKEKIKEHLLKQGHECIDCGTHNQNAVDYPDYAMSVASKVVSGECTFGIMIDGAGIGSAMTANKIPGILAAACYNTELARNSRQHNGANFLTLGAGQITLTLSKCIVDTFLQTECNEERHLRRVKKIVEIEKNSFQKNMDLTQQDIERIAQRVKTLLQDGTESPPSSTPIAPEKLAQMIDHTILKPDASAADVQKLCEEAIRYHFYSVCVNSSFVKEARKHIKNSNVKLCSVVGFPLGAQPAEIKALEARRAIREGAHEIDMVINIGALKSHDYETVLKDVRAVAEVCKDGRALSKVILETALLTDEEKIKACEISMQAGADYVKTSTGFSKSGATAEDISLMAETVKPKNLGVKASGGVRTFDDAIAMINAGATRIGASSSISIFEEAKKRFH